MRFRALFLVCLVPGLVYAQGNPKRFLKAAVVSDCGIASEVGARIMREGGNAVDAAIATSFALAVTFPGAGNIGGGGFMVVRKADGSATAIDYREMAPRKATRNMYLDPSGNLVPGSSTVGLKASGVPGTVAGLFSAHKLFGKLPWKKLVEPSVELAAKGFLLDLDYADDMRRVALQFKQFPATVSQFGKGTGFHKAGETFAQPDLGKTLARIADDGMEGFYAGETARLIAEGMRKGGGLIDEEDLKNYKSVVRNVLKGSYKGYEVLTMPPPSSGGVVLLQMLGILQMFDLKAAGFGSSEYLHILTETMKLSFADRAEYMGDPDFVEVPVTLLLSDDYINARRGGINLQKANPSSNIRAGNGPREGEHTTHFSVVDGEGNVVSVTTTLNTGYGCGAVVPGAGFLMNNEMDDFAAKPGTPNVFGLIQGEANAIAPGKRPLSSMTPTIVLQKGKPVLVLGSPGGPTIINTVLQSFLNFAEFGMNVQRAVAAPRFHHQWMPDEIRFEPFGLSSDLRKALEAMGHKFASRGASMGSCHAIFIDPATGERHAGVDPRNATSGAAGY